MKPLKVIHVPYSKRNPYQKLLGDNLKALGVKIEGAQSRHLFHISFLNITFLDILIKHRKPDIIHLHWHHSLLLEPRSRLKTVLKSLISLLQLVFLKLLGVKLVWTVHNLKRHEKSHQDLEKTFTRLLAKLSDVIIAHCGTAKTQIKREFSIKNDHKIVVIPHGNYIGCYPNSISREEARMQLNLSGSEMTFLFLGEVRYYKGVLELIDVFKDMGSAGIQLIIAGKPHDDGIVKEIAFRINGNRCIRTVLQFIPDDELQIYMNASDIVVHPFRDIFTSGGIILSMSFGKPIVAPCIGCITDTLDYEGSFLYDPAEQDGLSRAMRQALASKEDLKRMGRHNFSLAKQFEWSDIARLTRDAYVGCIKRSTNEMAYI